MGGDETFARFVRWWRTEVTGLTQRQAAALAGVGFATWQRYEAGTSMPHPGRLKVLASRLGVPGEVLLEARVGALVCDGALAARLRASAASTPAAAMQSTGGATLAFIWPDFTSPFFGYAMVGLEAMARRLGFRVVAYNSAEDVDAEAELLGYACEHDAGIIVNAANVHEDAGYETVIRSGVPLVFMDRYVASLRARFSLVQTDNVEGSYIATRHLLDCGHRRVYLLTERLTISAAVERKEGYMRAMREAGAVARGGDAEHERLYVLESPERYDVEAGRELARRLLNEVRRAGRAAAFCINDNVARGVYEIAAEAGVRIGRELSICGFDNMKDSLTVTPRLTSVLQDPERLGRRAARILIEQIRTGDRTPRTELFEAKLVPGESVATVRPDAGPAPEEAVPYAAVRLGFRPDSVYSRRGRVRN